MLQEPSPGFTTTPLQPSSTEPTTPQEYSGSVEEGVWPKAYHGSFQAACLALHSKYNSPALLWTGFLPWTSRFFTFQLVGEVEKVRAAGWRVLEDFFVLLGILPDRQHRQYDGQSAWPSDIPPCCCHSSGFSSIFASPQLHCWQLHSSTSSLFAIDVSWYTHTHFQLPSADWTSALIQFGHQRPTDGVAWKSPH